MAKCKNCGNPIKFTKNGASWLITNPDGSEHWGTCKAAQFELIKESGEFFEDGYVKGYRMSDGTIYKTQTGKRVVGKNYNPSGDCAECCVPWEVCTWPCPDAI
jgi:hypothetical protein